MDDRWYYRNNGKAAGPYTSAQIRQLIASGEITSETPLRQGEAGRWLRAGQVQGMVLQATAKPAPAAVSPNRASATPAKPAVRAKPAPAPAKVRVVQAATPAPGTTIVVPASPETSSGGHRGFQRRRQTALPLIAVVIVMGILLLGGGAATIIAFVTDPEATGDIPAEPASISPEVANSPAVDVPPKPSDLQREAADSSVPARESAIAAVKLWKPGIGNQDAKGGVKSSKMQVKFDRAWLGDDPQRDVGGPEHVRTKGSAKYLFVRLLVTNLQADQPLEYRGWNTAGPESEAILVDEDGHFSSLAPLAQGAANRLSNVSIAPKANAMDVLVFKLANPNFEQLRLALPFPGVGYCGFQIDQTMLVEPSQPANSPEVAQQPPVEEETAPPPASTPEVPATVAAETPAASDTPPDLDELQRSIAEQAGELNKAAGDKPMP